MCGICGYLEKNKKVSDELVLRMNDTLVHRGPDNGAIWTKDKIGLGHRRLSILDLSSAGHQPMQSRDNRYILTYNGEIYNYLEIKNDLLLRGYSFRGNSDTEVLLEGFTVWGVDIFKRLNGIFAVAIWDKLERKLYIARDRYGVKPLYYFISDNKLVFGSEIKAILEHADISRVLDEQSFHEFLYYGNAHDDRTLFKNIKKVLPGEYLEISEEIIIKHEFYWNINQIKENNETNEIEAVKTVQELLGNAVQKQLVSDVPIGVFLSGGIDSSAITAFASRTYSKKISTFSAAFDFEFANELKKAKTVADYFGTNHHELLIKGAELPNIIENLVHHHDEPFSDAANIPLFLLTNEVKTTHKVILQGDGGDEFFAGYRRYSTLSKLKYYQYLSYIIVRMPNFQHEKFERIKRFAQAIHQNSDYKRMALLLTVETLYNSPTSVLTKSFKRRLIDTDPFLSYSEFDMKFKTLDNVQKMLWADTQILLPNTFLEKVDKSTMANSVEVRVPFLDNDLSAYALALPSNLKVKNGGKKWILRQALRGIVPDEILDAPKLGFSVPYSNWLKKPLKSFLMETLYQERIVKENIFNYDILNAKIQEHIQGKKDNGFLLWKLMNFCIWVREYNVEIKQ